MRERVRQEMFRHPRSACAGAGFRQSAVTCDVRVYDGGWTKYETPRVFILDRQPTVPFLRWRFGKLYDEVAFHGDDGGRRFDGSP